jgi:hypothetical protein
MTQTQDYIVLTECGRNFCWAACSLDQLFRDMRERGYKVMMAQPVTEYEKEVFEQEQQRALEFELQLVAEMEGRKSA